MNGKPTFRLAFRESVGLRKVATGLSQMPMAQTSSGSTPLQPECLRISSNENRNRSDLDWRA